MIKLKDYQLEAIEELTIKINKLFTVTGRDKTCYFKSPTGSGKTVIVAKVIENVISTNSDSEICFLWVSIGKGELHIQSKKTLDYIFDGFPNCTLLEQDFLGNRTEIEKNEVVVINWEKIRNKDKQTGTWKNKVMVTGENKNFIEIIEETRKKRKIILIIDESHYASEAERAIELRQIINADVTLEMSATLKNLFKPEDYARGLIEIQIVDSSQVIQEGMIKKNTIINFEIDKLPTNDLDSQDIILNSAYNKREDLKELFELTGSKVNPLCLIQLPNSDAGETKKRSVLDFLKSKGATLENRKVALWLSNEKSEFLDEISNPENEVEFLLFKQAIDTGWDCPRASILVKLREIQSYIFEIQTLGRILRMPEQKHYEFEELNLAYVYTNLKQIEVKNDEYFPNYIKNLVSKRKSNYSPVKLQSYHKSRVDYGDITSSFHDVLSSTFSDFFNFDKNGVMINSADNFKIFSHKIQTQVVDLSEKILIDAVIDNLNFDDDNSYEGLNFKNKLNLKISEVDVFDIFNAVIRSQLQGFAPKRSVPIVRQAIYIWFEKYLNFTLSENGVINIQKIILNESNLEIFLMLITKSIEKYKPIKTLEVLQKITETYYDWEVKETEYFSEHSVEKINSQNNIYYPLYLNLDRSNVERFFEEFLDSQQDNISWWFKNGEGRKDYFGLKYIEDGLPRTFYPDYIIRLNNSKIIICDTKSGITARDSELKALTLEKYINESNRKLLGGIVIQDRSGNWRINTLPSKNFNLNNIEEWDFFSQMLN